MALGRGIAALSALHASGGSFDGVGLGCAPIGDLFSSVTEADAEATVGTALEAGIRFFDTAPHYGAGLSEQRLGRALRGVPRDGFSVATKVGRRLVEADGREVAPGALGVRTVPDLSADGVLRSLESSFARTGLDRVDVLYLHDPDDVDAALAGALPAMAALRDEGVVRAIGVGMNVSAPLARFAAEADIDVVMEAGRYTLLDRSAADELFPTALDRDVTVVAAGVFNTGVLADPVDGAPYDYRPAAPEVLHRARELQSRCLARGLSLSAAAVQFPLRHPAVGAVVVGARTPAEVRSFVADAQASVPDGLWSELERP
ncbi:D-threo-aldose 1-dehydrogenase [Agromyces hippuratus]|uniref:D-threo-aldose 1-dehydrogenase n=1 Tax=Agromyces hippuratus TaxID=286438 RepID=A0A852X4J4_9MICO|nr:aldo/keto reductase [Agromyces hippuratus]NYG22434.1 D-threo-aldose 1-dehydrogenase [Agromyces hippuratus]